MPACEPGTDLGHYRIVRLLGRGGMGDVYLARDLTLGREVAIKVLSGERGEGAGTRERLLREAQAAAALDHPNICGVYEAGETASSSSFIALAAAVHGRTGGVIDLVARRRRSVRASPAARRAGPGAGDNG
jgi:serine/threonine-protein kinase